MKALKPNALEIAYQEFRDGLTIHIPDYLAAVDRDSVKFERMLELKEMAKQSRQHVTQ